MRSELSMHTDLKDEELIQLGQVRLEKETSPQTSNAFF